VEGVLILFQNISPVEFATNLVYVRLKSLSVDETIPVDEIMRDKILAVRHNGSKTIGLNFPKLLVRKTGQDLVYWCSGEENQRGFVMDPAPGQEVYSGPIDLWTCSVVH
jgi:hypothetical protein